MTDAARASGAGRVQRLLERVGAHFDSGARAALIHTLSSSGSLSVEGARAIFDRTLAVELAASGSQIGTLVDRMTSVATSPPEIHLVLSSTIFSAPLRALACALARCERVTLSPSESAPFFAEALVAAADTDLVSLAPRRPLASMPPGSEVFVYGRGETISAIEQEAEGLGFPLHVHGHGPGFGIACVGTRREDDLADRLALDATLFDQEGCLSPRIVFFEGSSEEGERFADELVTSFGRLETAIPRGTLDADMLAAIERHVTTALLAGPVTRGPTFSVSVSDTVILPPPGRNLHLVASGATFEDRLKAFAMETGRVVTNVGVDAASPKLSSMLGLSFPRARLADIGRMQIPPLDGPVDRRTAFG